MKDYYAILLSLLTIGVLVLFGVFYNKSNQDKSVDRYYCAYNWSNGKNKFGCGSATVSVPSTDCCVQDSLSAIIERVDSSDNIVLVNFIKLEK